MPYEEPQRKGSGPAPLPAVLRAGAESLSGLDLGGVRVHRNSEAPAAVDALAFTKGSNIYLGPGQDHHLAHESWHVVQQMTGRVQQTGTVHGQPLNDNQSLEREADTMGSRMSSIAARTHSLARLSDEPAEAERASLSG